MKETILRLAVPGNPIPCPRPRVVRNHAYIPQKARTYIDMISWEVKLKMLTDHDSGGLWGLSVVFYRENKLRTDIDNLCKSILDAITNARFWDDDNQLIDLSAKKRYDKKKPRVEFELYKIEEK
jgi:Holliday junction resolvase RusA-like endonuclease